MMRRTPGTSGHKFFADNGEIASPDTRKFLQSWMDAYVAWIQRFAR
jgi:chromate reductase, NAD(P)H dehydrogenase (quinone)